MDTTLIACIITVSVPLTAVLLHWIIRDAVTQAILQADRKRDERKDKS